MFGDVDLEVEKCSAVEELVDFYSDADFKDVKVLALDGEGRVNLSFAGLSAVVLQLDYVFLDSQV